MTEPVYPYAYMLWPRTVWRIATHLRWLREHGQVGLQNAAARVKCMKVCGCGKKYTLYNLPERCECGVELNGASGVPVGQLVFGLHMHGLIYFSLPFGLEDPNA